MSALTFYGVPGKMTRRLLGVVIGTQGLAVFFGALVARALAAAEAQSATDGSNASTAFLVAGSVLAVLCILAAGLLRKPWGITLGWVLQIATLACVFIVPAMLVVGLIFGALWVTALVQGRTMDELTSRVDAQWYAAQEGAGPEPSGSGRPGEPAAERAGEETGGQQPSEPSTHDG